MKIKTDYIKFTMNGMTQKELSQKMGISRQWLSTILTRGYASMNMVNKFAKVLNLESIDIVILED